MTTTIIAKNSTAGDLSLSYLSAIDAKIPASGQSELTLWNRVSNIQEDEELGAYIENDQVILNIDGTDLTKEQSLSVLEFPITGAKNNYSATASPSSTDDDSEGYSIGSVWIDVSADHPYVCVDDSTNFAVWSQFGEGDDTQIDSAYLYTAAQDEIDSTSWTDVAGSSVNITTTGEGKIWALGSITGTTDAPSSGTDFEIRVVIDSENGGVAEFEPYDDLERAIVVHYQTTSNKNAGTYNVKLQARRISGSASLYCEKISVFSLGLNARGPKGEKGDPGGTTVDIQEDDVLVASNVDVLNFEGNVTATDEGGGKVTVSVDGSIWGSEFQQDSSLGASSTSSTSWQQKLRMTTGDLPAGIYRIGWSYAWRHSSRNSSFRGRVQVNDSDTIMEHRQEPKDQGSTQEQRCSGFSYESLSGVENIDLDYCASNNTAYIWEARLEIWRVS